MTEGKIVSAEKPAIQFARGIRAGGRIGTRQTLGMLEGLPGGISLPRV